MATTTHYHYHTRTKSCLNPNAGRGMLRSALNSRTIYKCDHEREESLRKDLLIWLHLRGTLRTGENGHSSPMETDDIPVTACSGRTEEILSEQSLFSDSTLHTDDNRLSSLIEEVDILTEVSSGYAQEVVNENTSIINSTRYTTENGHSGHLTFDDISIAFSSGLGQELDHHQESSQHSTIHTPERGRISRIDSHDILTDVFLGRAREVTVVFNTIDPSLLHTRDVRMTAEDVPGMPRRSFIWEPAEDFGLFGEESADGTSHIEVLGTFDDADMTDVSDEDLEDVEIERYSIEENCQ